MWGNTVYWHQIARVSWSDIMSECTIAASSVSTHCAIEGLKEIIHEVVGSVPDMS